MPVDPSEFELLPATIGDASPVALGATFERFRDYLLAIANQKMDPALQAKGGASDIVQETFLHPDGERVASASADRIVRLWDRPSGRVLREFVGHTASVRGVAISPDGQWMASCSVDQSVRLWDVESGRIRQVLEGHKSDVWCVAISPDGRTVASCDWGSCGTPRRGHFSAR